MLLFVIIVLRCFVRQSYISGGYFPGWVAHWLRTERIPPCAVYTFQAGSIAHLYKAYYFLRRIKFLCDASMKVDLTRSSSFLVLEHPRSCLCFLPQRYFCNCSICTCHHTLLCSRNKGIWTFFCPPNQCKTRMMGLLFFALLHICTHVCVLLSVQCCYCCSDGICIFFCTALLFLHRDTWKFSLPLFCKTADPST